MLESLKIQRRQSEIRQALSELSTKSDASEDEIRKMDEMEKEYRSNESRYRACLVAEDDERREAGEALEQREGREWDEMLSGFELRQVALYLDEGRELDGRTREVVQELRSEGGYRGIPVPYAALIEQRAGETIASGTPNPVSTMPIIDQLFANSVASRMGFRFLNIGSGETEWPLVTQGSSVGWQATETGNVAAAQAFQTTDRSVKPDHTLGMQMKITRKTLKQSGAALEAAVRRDMMSVLRVEMDKAVFLGSGASGQPTGIITGIDNSPQDWASTATAINADATYAIFRAAAVRFMQNNAANSLAEIRILMRPEVFDKLDETISLSGLDFTDYERLIKHFPSVVMTTNAIAAPTGSPTASDVLLTTTAGGVAPAVVASWGAIDMIRDPYSDAQSGGLRLTALATMDVSVLREEQLELLQGVRD